MSSVYKIGNISKFQKGRETEIVIATVKLMWERKIREMIERNPNSKEKLEAFIFRELKFGGSFFDIQKTYSSGKNCFFVLFDEFENIRGFAGISSYSNRVYEISKHYFPSDDFPADFLIQSILRYYRENLFGFDFEIVIEEKNSHLLSLLLKNNFEKNRKLRSGTGIHLRYIA